MTGKAKPTAAFIRLPVYLNYLQSLGNNTPIHISSAVIAQALGMGEVQVRKDLASVCGGGKPKIGYVTADLIERLRTVLGYKKVNNAVIVGAGKLGRALLEYEGFSNYGLNIVAAFDNNECSEGLTSAGKMIYHINELPKFCFENNIRIGIITVPASQAQATCDLLTENSISAIWNFSPSHLDAPPGVIVQNENMAVSLAVLCARLDITEE